MRFPSTYYFYSCLITYCLIGVSAWSSNSRRGFFDKLWKNGGAVLAVASSPLSSTPALAEVDVRGTAVTPFNGLMFQYRGSEFGGLTAGDLNGEESITYADFMDKLKAGQVESVEFLAPDGDKAYATLKESGKSIRIGEGYPIEQHDGFSSPAFAIRAVKNAGVPYKFTVPALTAYKKD